MTSQFFLELDKILLHPPLTVREVLLIRTCLAVVLSYRSVSGVSRLAIEDLDRRLTALCDKKLPGKTACFSVEEEISP